MSKTIVVVPTYNESENLPRLSDALLSLPGLELELLVVDDSSPDGTGELAERLAGESGGRVHVLHRPGKQGLGAAYIHGFEWALEQGAEQIVQMDADFSHNPNDVPRLLAALQNCDVAIGSRYVRGGRLDEKWSAGRRLLSWFANRIWVNLILGTNVCDSTAGFRAWRRQTLAGIDVRRLRCNGYNFQVELTHVARRLGYVIQEVPIYFADRTHGHSKMRLSNQIDSALGVILLRWRYRHLKPANRAPAR